MDDQASGRQEHDNPGMEQPARGSVSAAPGQAEVFPWTDAFLLGMQEMDDTHREFVELVNHLVVVEDVGYLASLERFAEHAHSHFEQEDQWMEATAFPPRDCHIGEHAAVLKSVHEVIDYLKGGGEVEIGRSLARELMNWFPGHADYLDAALAQWMIKKRTGGAPVVLRRGTQSCNVPIGSETEPQS